jgi:integrase
LTKCSAATQLVAQASLAPTTVRQYSFHGQKFVEFLEKWGINDDEISEISLMDFISEFVLKKVSHSYVRQLFAAAKRVALHKNPSLLIDPNLLSQVLNGAKNLCRPPKVKQFTWDPTIVLEFLEALPIPGDVKSLAAECALILALSTGLRVSDLNRLGSEATVSRDSFSLPFLEKTKTGFRDSISIQPLKGSDRICPFIAYCRYVTASTDLCKNSSLVRDKFLFVSATTGKRVQVVTIRNWMVSLLERAGISASAGSTRSAAASSAWWNNLSFDSIARMAGWKRESTFQRFYKKPLSFSGANLMNPSFI